MTTAQQQHDPPFTPEEQELLDLYHKPMQLKVRRAPSAATLVTNTTADQQQQLVPAPSSTPTIAASEPNSQTDGDATTTNTGSTTKTVKRARLAKSTTVGGSEIDDHHSTSRIELERPITLLSTEWDSRTATEPLMLELTDLDVSDDVDKGLNTIEIVATMPRDSERFAINIQPNKSISEQDAAMCVLYHFNPRDRQGRQSIVHNSFAKGGWMKEPDRKIPNFPLHKDVPFELKISVCKLGFATYVDGVLLAEYRHRVLDLPLDRLPNKTLFLCVPLEESRYHDREKIVIHSVKWGRILPLTSLRGGITGANQVIVNVGGEDVERTLFVGNLPKDGKALERLHQLFEHYQIDTRPDGTMLMQADADRGTGYVKLVFEENVKRAIQYLHNTPTGVAGERYVVQRANKRQFSWV